MPSEEMLVLDVQGLDTLVDEIKPKLHTHKNEDILDEITAPFTTELLGKLDGIEENANNYVLPVATSETLGGVKVGSGLVADGDGVLSATVEDTKVTQELTAESADYPVLLAPSGQKTTETTTAYFGTGMQYNPSTNNLSATSFTGSLNGNAATADVATKLGTSTVGGAAKPIYLSSGTATACSSTVGSGVIPVYMSSGTITASTSTVGSGTKPIYLSSGTLTVSSSTVGSGTKPIYLSSGTLTVSSSTVGGATVPTYLNSGTITACTSLSLDTTGNAATADVATKLGSTTVGGTAQPIYLSSGTATACSATVGSGVIPVYMSSGTIAASSSTVGSGTKPIYMSSGTLTVSSSTVGSGTKPVYLSSGTITVSSSTVGSASVPVYLSSGTVTACTSLSLDTTGNAATADVATKLGSSTVGGAAKPIYLSSGTATACSSTVGSGVIPVYMSSGTITASTSTVGSGTKPIYLSSGTLTVSSSTVGSGVIPTYLSSGTVTASTSTVGSGTKPIYLSSGTLTVSSSTVGSSSVPVYLNSGTITACSTLVEGYQYATYTLPATAGWYRIASSASGIANNVGLFTIRGQVSGRHTMVTMEAGISYNTANSATCNILNVHSYSTTFLFSQVRIVYHSTYSGNYAYLEIYQPSAYAGVYKIFTVNCTGWTLCDAATEGSIPDGYTSKTFELTNGALIASTIVGNLTGNATTADTATKLGSSTVGGAAKPIYLSSGTATACSSTVGSGVIPVYMSSGTMTASTSTVGSGTKPIYLSSGTLTVSSSTVGSGVIPTYLSSGTVTASTSTVGSGTKPIYLSSGTLTASSSTVGSASQPVYLSSGTLTACNSISTSVDGTLTSSGWSGSGPYTQSVTMSGVTSSSNGVLGLAQSATDEQRDAARDASLNITAQATNSITITADGDKPSVNIPITLILLG